MLLLRAGTLPERRDWVHELKLDGYRAIAARSGGEIVLRSRNDRDLGASVPSILRALTPMPAETILDGELVALDEEGKPSFNLLQHHKTAAADIVYYVFDLLYLRRRNVMSMALAERLKLLSAEVMPNLTEPIRASPRLDGPLSRLIDGVKAAGLEGLVAKRLTAPYEPGLRTGAWQKMRTSAGQEFVIGGYTPSAKNFDALILGYYQKGELHYASRTRNGFTPPLRAEIFRKLQPLERKTCPFANLPQRTPGRWGQGLTADKMKECRWLKPVTVAQFEFVEWTPDGHLRHPKFIGIRADKAPADVVRERAVR